MWLGLLGLALLLVVPVGWGMARYASADHLGVLDDPVVVHQARSACDQLSSDVQAIAGSGSTDVEAAARIRAQDVAIRRLVASMNELGQDRLTNDNPAVDWVADWQTLLALREAYAADLLAGRNPTLTIPTVDNIPITHRMRELSSCAEVDSLARV